MKKMYIITYGQDQCSILKTQLEELFGENVEIVGAIVDELDKIDFTDGLVVFSSSWVENYAQEKNKIGDRLDYLVAERVINYNHMDKLVQLNDGEDVLVCSDSEEFSQSIIEQFKDLGLGNINFIPCLFNSANERRVKTVIVFVNYRTLPRHVEKIIDMGARMLSIYSIMNIIKKLNLVQESENIILFQFINKLMDVLKKHKEESNQHKEIKGLYQAIVNNTSEGIIYTNIKGFILVSNSAVESFFQMEKSNIVGANIKNILPKEMRLLEPDFEKEIVLARGYEVALSRIAVKKDEQIIGFVFIFQDTKKIINTERKIRLKNLQQEILAQYYFKDIIYSSPKIQKTVEYAKKFALSDDTILIQGESGTGKELFAQAIHNFSPRCNGPFVAVNFAALTETLLESELFGYEEGSFTGAQKGGKRGLFERAHGGTIFIDEIGDVSVAFQSKLLRVLQERQVKRVGSTEIIPIDIRVIVASNLDLWEEVFSGRFRKDLFFRLNVLPITIPSLRERKEDIPVLLEHFLRKNSGAKVIALKDYFSPEALTVVMSYEWPGNVRELLNSVKYLNCIKSDKYLIEPEDLIFYEKQKEGSPILPEMLWLLRKIAENKGAGRRYLANLAQKEKIKLSEGQIRKLTKQLELAGYLSVNIGAQGCIVTDKGKVVILREGEC